MRILPLLNTDPDTTFVEYRSGSYLFQNTDLDLQPCPQRYASQISGFSFYNSIGYVYFIYFRTLDKDLDNFWDFESGFLKVESMSVFVYSRITFLREPYPLQAVTESVTQAHLSWSRIRVPVPRVQPSRNRHGILSSRKRHPITNFFWARFSWNRNQIWPSWKAWFSSDYFFFQSGSGSAAVATL